jgi:large subunit ribosomal protein L5
MEESRLKQLYTEKICPDLQQELGIANIMAVPKLVKIVINIGVKEAVSDSKALATAERILDDISGQKSVRRLARKSIAGFKLREGMPIGVMVTLRKTKMYDFLDRLISFALPRIRDFQGVTTTLDGQGSYNLGIRDTSIFPEVDFGLGDKLPGLNVTIQTTARTDAEGRALLRHFGMPFRKDS